MQAMTIHLGRLSPAASRDLPGWRPGNRPAAQGGAIPIWSCSRRGLPCRLCRQRRGALLPHPFTLTVFGWGRRRRFAFCGAIPGVSPAGRYPAPYFRGARTFLSHPARGRTEAAIRPSDL